MTLKIARFSNEKHSARLARAFFVPEQDAEAFHRGLSPPMNLPVGGIMKSLFSWLMPELDQEQRNALWRIAIAILLVGHIAWACGLLPGFGGFVLASEYQGNHQLLMAENRRLSKTITSVETTLLEKDIIDTQRSLCKAIAESNQDARRFALDRRNKLLRRWQDLVGEAYQLPTCAELGIS